MTFKMNANKKISIKICGITTTKQAEEIAKLNINAIGVIGVSQSTRHVNELLRRKIFSTIMDFNPIIHRVWVLANPTDSEIISGLCGNGIPSVIQLHGDESPERCQNLKERFPEILWWKAIRIKNESNLLFSNTFENKVDALLLDAWSDSAKGGTGERIPIKILKEARIKIPWWLAGGVSAEWIPDLLKHVNPYGIDASSKLEISPGIKDIELIKDLIQAVK